jgi:hypothetical protein
VSVGTNDALDLGSQRVHEHVTDTNALCLLLLRRRLGYRVFIDRKDILSLIYLDLMSYFNLNIGADVIRNAWT